MVRRTPPAPDGDVPDCGGSSRHIDDIDLIGALTRPDLPVARFDRWSVWVPTGSSLASSPARWVDAVGLIAHGDLVIDAGSSDRPRFAVGDLLALGALPACRLINPGDTPTQLVVVRRRAQP